METPFSLLKIPNVGTLVEKEMATHSSTRAWKIPWLEGPGPWGRKESGTTE